MGRGTGRRAAQFGVAAVSVLCETGGQKGGAVSEVLLAAARAGSSDAFAALVERPRAELRVHCYMLLGSVQDAEDALQETLLAAWRGLPGYQGRASLRTWLYVVATSRCLNLRRPRVGHPPTRPAVVPPEPSRLGEVLWLEPYPDVLLDAVPDPTPGPEARYEATAISLAFITAVQLLPPRQRAVLVLRDVLGFRAREFADMLDSTEESVTSALRRARAAVNSRAAGAARASAPPAGSPAEHALVAHLTAAFQAGDVAQVVTLLTADVVVSMPPMPLEYHGRDAAGRFLATVALRPGAAYRLVVTRANRQPALGVYLQEPHTGLAHANGLLVLTLRAAQISAVTGFGAGVFPRFDLPRYLRD